MWFSTHLLLLAIHFNTYMDARAFSVGLVDDDVRNVRAVRGGVAESDAVLRASLERELQRRALQPGTVGLAAGCKKDAVRIPTQGIGERKGIELCSGIRQVTHFWLLPLPARTRQLR